MLRGRLSKTTLAAAFCAATAFWLSFGLLAVTDADRARRIGLLPSVWWLALLILATIALSAAVRLSARASLPLFLSILVLLPWVPLPLPDVLLAWTGPSVLLVWGAIAFSMVAGFVSNAPARRHAWLRDPRVAPRVAAGLAFVAFLAVRSGQRLPPTGDEPHYLVLAQSLLYDHDLQVVNNYERADYFQYYGGPLEPHLSLPGVAGKLYSFHAPGLSALIAPAFAVGGYRAVVLWMAALTAIGTALVWKAGYLLTRKPDAAWFGWAVVALTVPGVLFGSLIYPDTVAGLLFAGGALALVLANERARGAPPTDRDGGATDLPWPLWGSLGLGVAVGVLPWLHTRLAVPAAALAALLTLHSTHVRRRGRGWWLHAAAFGMPSLLGLVGWLLFFRTIYGTFNPMAPYGAGVPLEVRQITSGLSGLLMDQEFGLFWNAPVHLLALGGFWALFRRNGRLGIELLLLIVPYGIALTSYVIWWAGFTPPARFLLPIVFPLGIAAASAWAGQDARGKAMSLTLLGASVLVAAVLAFGGDGVLAYNGSTGRARWLDWVSPLIDLPRGFPSFFRATSPVGSSSAPTGIKVGVELVGPTMLWAIALLVGWVLFVALDRRLPAAVSVRAFVAPSCLTLVFVLGVAASWRAGGQSHIVATRVQLGLLRDEDPRTRPLGVQLFPAQLLPAADVPARLAISTSRLDAASPDTLLYLADVPRGAYRVRVTRSLSAHGELTLGVGRASLPIARWSVSEGPTSYLLNLPVRASSLVVTGDAEAARSIDKVALVPVRSTLAKPAPMSTWARDAARYGSSVVYALDDRIWLEPHGFWVMGERQPDVLVATDLPVGSLDFEVRNGPLPNRLRVRAGAWSSERTLTPNERWPVHVPVGSLGQAIVVNFEVERGFRPVDVDPASGDIRLLGCWIEVR